MILKIKMPRLSDTMTEGYIDKWHKSVGDQVAEGEALVDLETDKSTVEYPSPVTGTLSSILVDEGDELIRVGEVIAEVIASEAGAKSAGKPSDV